MSYSKSHVILIAFALDTPDSLENVTTKVSSHPDTRSHSHVRPKWIEEVRNICGPTIPVILVGCKADNRPSPIPASGYVTPEQGNKVAKQIGARAYKECSALKIEGVDEVFETATRASMLMRDGIAGTGATPEGHHRRKSSGPKAGGTNGTNGTAEEEGSGWKCCVVC